MEKIKQCTSCKKNLTLDNFLIHNRKNWKGLRSKCKACGNLEMRINYSKNPIPQILGGAKRRAKQKNIPFAIDAEYLKSIYPKNNMCPVLNISFQVGYKSENKKNADYAPSLDRIIPEKGYVKGNLIIVCNIVNRVKTDSSIEIIEKVLNFYKKIELTKTLK